MEIAAGVLVRCNDAYLLTHNAERGRWEAPGGHVEAGETEKEAALRELAEETGIELQAARKVDRSEYEGVEFHTFLQDYCPREVRLNGELDDYGWFAPDELPEGTHPEVVRLLEELTEMPNELEIARAIAQGVLPSPTRFGAMYLFAVRITGTGVSYRPDLDEYVYRPKEWYLNDDFLVRCGGIPVIFLHPDGKKLLDTEEYRGRTVGSVMFGYIAGDEVWGIARIHDDDAAQLMTQSHRSTSPAVAFGNRGGENKTVGLDTGEHVLFEGDPILIDHLAICEVGVWDKGTEGYGVQLGFHRDR